MAWMMSGFFICIMDNLMKVLYVLCDQNSIQYNSVIIMYSLNIDKAQLIIITVDHQASAFLNQTESTQLGPLIKAIIDRFILL